MGKVASTSRPLARCPYRDTWTALVCSWGMSTGALEQQPRLTDTDRCDKVGTSHSPQNEEWQAEAFHEGIANFYAMVAVNASSDDDCSWVCSTQDYD